MKRWLVYLMASFVLAPGLAVFVLSALIGERDEEQAAGRRPPEVPEFVYYSPEIERGYQLAVRNQQLFVRIPCYCGCGVLPQDPHRSLLDCFINGDGSFDPHASGCEVCLDIAVDAVRWQDEGKGAAEIRGLIDAKYRGYGPSTGSRPAERSESGHGPARRV